MTARGVDTITGMVYVHPMACLGSERILEMFAALGLGTEAERKRYCALAKVGVVDVVKDEKQLVFLSDGGTADGSAEDQGNAQLS